MRTIRDEIDGYCVRRFEHKVACSSYELHEKLSMNIARAYPVPIHNVLVLCHNWRATSIVKNTFLKSLPDIGAAKRIMSKEIIMENKSETYMGVRIRFMSMEDPVEKLYAWNFQTTMVVKILD